MAGIDVHKRVLMVAVAEVTGTEGDFECRRFGVTVIELRHMIDWLRGRGVQEAVMESTAQYWKPVWLELEPLSGYISRRRSRTEPAAAGKPISVIRSDW